MNQPDAHQELLDLLTAQQHDQDTARQIVQAVLALGYRIERPARGLDLVEGGAIDARAQAVAACIDDADATLLTLMALWRTREAEVWSRAVALYRRFGERVLKLGAPFVALDAATEGLECFPRDVRLRQIQGLAWARSEAPERAHRILADLATEGHCDEETLGMLARTHKDFGLAATDPAERRRHFRTAQEVYASAYQLTGGYWTGINAATLAALLGDSDSAVKLAGAVRAQCLHLWNAGNAPAGDRFWLLATLGEAELNLRDWSAAKRWYRSAAEASLHRFGDRVTTRRQARLLLHYLGRDSRWIDELLSIPKVTVFVGHMCDRPGRTPPRFPAALERPVQEAIRAHLVKHQALVGFASAACGSDILFLEALLALKGEPHVVLPYEKDEFARDSVEIVPGSDWSARFAAVLERATQVISVSKEKVAGGVAYDYANLVLHGLATERAKELETELMCLAVWDGRSGDGPGGTASVVERWRKIGAKVELIDLAGMLRQECPELAAASEPVVPAAPPVAPPAPQLDTRVMAILFADAVGFSRFSEEQVVGFARHCLGAVSDLLQRLPGKAVARATWGDGVYLVFETVADVGLFALELCDVIGKTNWRDKGLPEGLTLRIALHAGPLSRCYDPVAESWTYLGTHACRAARIEPITPPGQVYASQAFAALAALEKVAGFTCSYVKQVEWAKQYGTFPTYIVRRRSS